MREPGDFSSGNVVVIVVKQIGIGREDFWGYRLEKVFPAGEESHVGKMKIINEGRDTNTSGLEQFCPLFTQAIPVKTIDIPEENDDGSLLFSGDAATHAAGVEKICSKISSIAPFDVGR